MQDTNLKKITTWTLQTDKILEIVFFLIDETDMLSYT